MQKILEINVQLSKLEQLKTSIKASMKLAPSSAILPSDENNHLNITPAKCQEFSRVRDEFLLARDNIIERINIALTLEEKPIMAP